MPPGKRRKVSQDENSARDGIGSRLVTPSSASEEKIGEDEVGSPLASEAEKRVQISSKTETVTSKSDGGEVIPEETKTQLPLIAKRSSTRVVKKKIRRDVSPTGSPVKKAPAPESKKESTKTGTPEAKTKRQWEMWYEEDIKTFYDALFEFGKDFDAIQSVVAQQSRKRGVHPSLIKNKEQVRHFYYRTVHKINRFIENTQAVKKDTQELYALVNFGTLRESIKCLNDKTGQKLNELMQCGVTTVRYKGKNRRIRTPACIALKKLNNIEDPKDPPAPKVIPNKITIELGPKTNKAWTRVQSLSQNPRLRLKLGGDRSLGSIITYLQKKWTEHRLKLKDSIEESDPTNRLAFYPHSDVKLAPIALTRHVAPKVDVSFASYKENLMGSPTTSACKAAKKSSSAEDVPKPSSDNSSESENVSPSPPKIPKVVMEIVPASDQLKQVTNVPMCPAPEISLLMGDDNAMFPDRPMFFDDDSFAINRPSMSSSTVSSVNHECDIAVTGTDTGSDDANHGDNPELGDEATESQDSVDVESKDMVEKAKHGWTALNSNTLTLAQVYLMCGEDDVVRLEYDWCENTNSLEPHLMSKLTNMLRRLAHIATIEFVDPTRAKVTAEPPEAKKQILCSLCGAVAERFKNKSAKAKVKSGKAFEKSCATEDASVTKTSPTSASTVVTTTITPMSTSHVTHVKPRVLMTASRKEIIPNTGDGVFRVPMGVPLVRYPQSGVLHNVQQKQSISMIPKRRKVVRPKPLIVQRTLLPKAPSGQIVTILPSNVISPQALSTARQSVTPQTFSPASLTNGPGGTPLIASQTPNTSLSSDVTIKNECSPVLSQSVTTSQQGAAICFESPSSSQSHLTVPLTVNTDMAAAATPGLLIGTSSASDVAVSAASSPAVPGRSHDLSISPPNLSSLLDMSLSCPPAGNMMADKILDMALVNSNSSFSALLDTASLKMGSTPATSFRSMDESSRLITPPHSPSHIGASSDTQWLNGVVGDLSLSSFLTSPAKKSESTSQSAPSTTHFPSSIFSENSQESIVSKMDVDQTLQVMMSENSMDYVSKFESLAAHIDGRMPGRNTDSKT